MVPLNLYQIFLLFVLGQGFFLTYILFSLKRGNSKANRILAGVVFLMTYYIFVFFLNDSGYRSYIPVLIINGYSIAPLIPVFIYFYFKQLTTKSLGKNYLLHFIPFVLQFLYWLPNNTSGIFHTLSDEAFSIYYSTTIVRSVSGTHILIFGIYNYIFYKKMNFDYYNIQYGKLKWLKKIRILYTILFAIFSLGLLSLWFTNTEVARYIFFAFLSFFVYLIGYYGYVQSDILFEVVQKFKPKYYHSKLTTQQSEEIYGKLLLLMNEEKLYLNPNIKLADVASHVNTTPHHLSRVINENHGENFVDFINKYRVEEAKSILIDEKKESLKMFAVALDSGFGNKVSFYKNFKKFSGNLPIEFRNQHG